MSDPICILVIDDDPMQLELVERALSRDGFEVRCATDVGEVETTTRTFTPQIVLMDCHMPGTSGTQIIAATRGAAASARIILYSSWEASRLRALQQELGADGFISKDESIVAIAKKLRELATR